MANILKLSNAVSLAFHSVITISENGDNFLSVKDIAQKLNVSENHLSKVMQRLVKTSILKSERGANGGFSLGRKPENITLIQIYETIEGPFIPSNCLFLKDMCPRKACIMGNLLSSVNKIVFRYLSATKISDLSERKVKTCDKKKKYNKNK